MDKLKITTKGKIKKYLEENYVSKKKIEEKIKKLLEKDESIEDLAKCIKIANKIEVLKELLEGK